MTARSFIQYVSIASALLVTGCASGSKQLMADVECPGAPAWTCMTSGKCPIPELGDSLCAVGRSDYIASEALGLETASVRARGEMARVLEFRADQFTRAIQDSLSERGAGEESIQKVGNLNQNLVGRTMNGVTVPRTFANRETGTWYALAAIDVKTFASALKGLKEAGALSDSIKQEIDRRADSIVDEWEAEVEKRKAGR